MSTDDAKRAVIEELKAAVPEDAAIWPDVGRELERTSPRGYVYACAEDSANVYINWAGRTRLRDKVAQLQVGNPRELRAVAVLRRDNVRDAQCVCETLFAGLELQRVRGNWFAINGGVEALVAAFGRIDRLEHSEPVGLESGAIGRS